jgi:hypothetical protein
MKKIIFFILVLLFFINHTEAFEFDNSKKFEKENLEYGKVKIKNLFGLGRTLEEITLNNNTDVCGKYCSAKFKIELYEGGSLIDDIKYYKIDDKGDFKETKKIIDELFLIGEDGSKKPYSIGKEVSPGTYIVELKGEKIEYGYAIDWVVKTKGVWINEWAIWNYSTLRIEDNKTIQLCGDYYHRNIEIINSTISVCSYNQTSGTGEVRLFAAYNFTMDSLSLIDSNSDGEGGGPFRGFGSGLDGPGVTGNGTGGGGGGGSYGGAGGGAGYGNVGGDGGDGALAGGVNRDGGPGGISYDNSSNESYFLGSGGGSGGVKAINGRSGYGGDGGGIVYIKSRNININGFIRSNGQDGGCFSGSSVADNGGGGGGAGGTIIIFGGIINLSNSNLQSNGGNGGSVCPGDNTGGGGGGGGAGGRIKVFYNTSIDTSGISISSTGGTGGLQNQGDGATDGSPGNSGTYYEAQIPIEFEDPYPLITLNYPLNDTLTDEAILFNCSGETIGEDDLKNISLYTNQTGSFELINTTSAIGESFIYGLWENLYNESNRTFLIWGCEVCDIYDRCNSSENRTLEIDLTLPKINITSPTGIYDVYYEGLILDLNWTTTNGNIDSCWYEYNNTNTSIGCFDNHTTFVATDQKNITIYSNNTLGNIGYNTTSWDSYLLEESQTFNEEAAETSYQQFSINVTYNPNLFQSISSKINYDGINYSGLITPYSNYFISTSTIAIPSVDYEMNKSFYWEFSITLNNGTQLTGFSSSKNQTINKIIFQECNSTINTVALNFTTYLESLFNTINSGLEATFNYRVLNSDPSIYQTYSFSDINENRSNYLFCIYPETESFIIDATVSYFATGYDRREYFFDNATISNNSQDIGLYLSPTNETDIFTFKVVDEDENPVGGAYIRVLRWDIGTDNFYTVSMLVTSGDGTAITNLRLYDAWYKYQVIYDGELRLTTEKLKEGSASRILIIDTGIQDPYVEYDFEGLAHNLIFNNDTNVFVYEYAATNGGLLKGCLKVIELQGNSTEEIYFSCVSSTSGTLSYPVVKNGTYIAQGIIYLNQLYDSINKVTDEYKIRIGIPERFEIISGFGKVISMILTGTLVMVGVATGSIVLGLTLVIASLIIENKLGWLNISETVLFSIISIIILVIVTSTKKR